MHVCSKIKSLLISYPSYYFLKLQGLAWLDKGYLLDGFRSPMCTVSLLGYHIVGSPLLGKVYTNPGF